MKIHHGTPLLVVLECSLVDELFAEASTSGSVVLSPANVVVVAWWSGGVGASVATLVVVGVVVGGKINGRGVGGNDTIYVGVCVDDTHADFPLNKKGNTHTQRETLTLIVVVVGIGVGIGVGGTGVGGTGVGYSGVETREEKKWCVFE
jgi:hypothetical protein